MRSRNIKPSLFKNEVLGVADPLLTVVFAGLWCAADREGRIEDRPLRLKAEILPYRENIDFNVYLTELERLEFICRYEAENVRVIEVINFKKHQNPHKTERASELPEKPAITEGCEITVKPTLNNGSRPADSLIPDSLIPLYVKPKESKEKPKKNKVNTDEFRPDFISKELWVELIKGREIKKLQNTKLALKTFCNAILKAIEHGYTAEQCIGEYVASKWDRFNFEWMADVGHTPKGSGKQNCKDCDYRARGACKQEKPDCKSFMRAA